MVNKRGVLCLDFGFENISTIEPGIIQFQSKPFENTPFSLILPSLADNLFSIHITCLYEMNNMREFRGQNWSPHTKKNSKL